MDKRPDYYGGAGNPYEVFKVIRAWGMDFFGGNVLKYVRRAGKKVEPGDDARMASLRKLDDLIKARTYLNQMIEDAERELAAHDCASPPHPNISGPAGTRGAA